MRFAYIDSQGNEVTIPSVDALALRIELGAIGPDTDLYDAQADRWGPAQTHEIFHTLSRDVGGDAGFVAPPPPVVPSPPEVEREAEPEPIETAQPEKPPEEGPSFDFSAPLTLVDEGAAAEEPAESAPASGGGDDLGFGLDLTLADEAEPEAPSGGFGDAMNLDLAPGAPKGGPPEPPKEEEPVGFDFGEGLELAPEPFETPEPEAATPGPGKSGEGSMDFSPGSAFGDMEMEAPLSDFAPESTPSWAEQDGPVQDGAMAFGGEGAAADDDNAASSPPEDEDTRRHERPKREPKNRPSPPKRSRSKAAPTGAILGVLGLAVVAGGGYFGWKALQGGGGGGSTEAPVVALPAVTIPDIPAELLPMMRDMGEAALAGTLAELRAMQTESDVPLEPDENWLAGVYLANASQYRNVQLFWEGIEAYVDRVRETDTQVFHDQYVAQLEAAGVVGDTARMLLERADSGFLSTREDRFEAYRLMDDLVIAALDLHAFLLRNEPNIEYDPAAGGVSRDPVLEAVPNSRALGNEMWGMVDRITGALDALGTLDRVTTERLTAVLFDRIRRAGFR